MNWLRHIERRVGRFALPHLTVAIVLVQGLTYLAAISFPDIIQMMPLDTAEVMRGQWWRLISFLMIPPASNPIFLFFALYLLYLMGTALEREWGDFRYNLYWLIGYTASVGLAFLVPGQAVTNGYLSASVFLAFAFLFPDFELLLFFILPVKVKWLALITWVLYAIMFMTSVGLHDWGGCLMIAAATLNFFLFFGKDVLLRMKRGHRRMQRQKQAIATKYEVFHCCSVCGRTDQSDPALEFRYAKLGEEVVCYCIHDLPREMKPGR